MSNDAAVMSDEEHRTSGDLAPVLAVIVAGTIGAVLQWTKGSYRPMAVVLLGLALLVTLTALFCRIRIPIRTRDRAGSIAVAAVLALSLALFGIEAATPDPMPPGSAGIVHAFRFALLLVAFGVGLGVAAPAAHLRRFGWFPLLVVLHFAMGCLALRLAPKPFIDVWTIEMEAVRGLLDGRNPFAMTYTDPYGSASGFFPPGASVDGRLQFGFVYPPLALLLCVPGYLLGGDTRWSMLVAMEATALFMGYCREGKTPKLVALAFLYTPRAFFVLALAWTDPFVVLLTAATVFAALRYPRWLFIPIGLYVCLKQHMFIGIPALFLLLPRPLPWRRAGGLAVRGGLVAALVTLPLALWDVRAFAHSVFDIREVFRTDSLGMVALFHNTRVVTLSKWTGLLAIIPVIVVGSLRAPRTPSGFALLAAATHFTLYLWSTHGFCNEYYNVLGALACAAAAWEDDSSVASGALDSR